MNESKLKGSESMLLGVPARLKCHVGSCSKGPGIWRRLRDVPVENNSQDSAMRLYSCRSLACSKLEQMSEAAAQVAWHIVACNKTPFPDYGMDTA